MISLQAPAKINLTLEVLARRDDGYHGIRSVMVPLDLADELTIAPSSAFSFACDRSDLQGERNLAYAAVRALGESPPVRIALHKRIPVQAGLGGGSSDAAAVLRAAMMGAFGSDLSRDWLRVARVLGSDVPFFLAGTAALVEGTGERVTPAGAIPRWHVGIVKPPVAISTAEAYALLDTSKRPSRARSSSVSIAMLASLQRSDFAVVESLLQNDFHDVIATQSAEVRRAVSALHSAGATNAMLAGSGSCVFTIAPQREQVDAVFERLDLSPAYERLSTAFAATPQWSPSTGSG
jgi:4-diphosphocytidyl-2-C-methyl-D-erythritol kinase